MGRCRATQGDRAGAADAKLNHPQITQISIKELEMKLSSIELI
jgi:hypothetical protein